MPARPPIAHADVTLAVLAVGNHAAVVVRVGLLDEEELSGGSRQSLRPV